MGNKTTLTPPISHTMLAHRNVFNGKETSKSNISLVVGRHGLVRVGSDDPHWKFKIANGIAATNGLSVMKQSFVYAPGHVESSKTFNGKLEVNSSEYFYRAMSPFDAVSIELRNRIDGDAAIGLRRKIRQKQSAWGGLESVAELSKSIKMIRNPAESIRKLLNNLIHDYSLDPCRKSKSPRAYRKCRRYHAALARRNKRALPRSFGQSWLEFQFGWKPAVGVIQDALNASLDLIVFERSSVSFKTDGSESSVAPKYAARNPPGLSGSYEIRTTATSFVKTRCTLSRQVDIEGGRDGIQRTIDAGFRADNIVPTIWELVPWSVFMDYFANIGDLLSAHCTSLQGASAFSTTTYNLSEFEATRMVWKESGGYALRSQSPGRVSCKFETITRSARIANIDYTLRWTLPGSPIQSLNIAGLLSSFL